MSIFSKVMYISYYRVSQRRRFHGNITEVILCRQDDVPGKHVVTNHELVAYRIAIALSCRLKKMKQYIFALANVHTLHG